jgi:hypothetical protein
MINKWTFLFFMGIEMGLLTADTGTFLTTDLDISRFALAALIRLACMGILIWLYERFGEGTQAQ